MENPNGAQSSRSTEPTTRAPVRPKADAPTEPPSGGHPAEAGPPVDPNHVEPVGTNLGEPAKQHWDTKEPETPSTSEP
jgi:hypothetical protein